jgi:putative tryptophan/tyrosine transport system substrate-binding protein
MMTRFLLSCLILFFALTVSAEAETRKIILLETMPVPVVKNHSKAIEKALMSLEQNSNWKLDLEILKAQGDKQRAINLLKVSLEESRPDLVITIATLASQAAKEVLSGSGIPILFCVVIDPVGAGIINQVGVPDGNNISGVVYTQHQNSQVEAVLQLLNHHKRNDKLKFGIVSSDYPAATGGIRELKKIAANSDEIEFVTHTFPYRPIPEGLPQMLADQKKGVALLKHKIDYFWEGVGPLSEIGEATQTLIDTGKPVINGYTAKSVQLGVIMAVVTNYQETGKQIAEMAKEIFLGRDVGTIVVTTPRKFNLFINMKTAKKFGIKPPSHMLMIAGDNVIN